MKNCKNCKNWIYLKYVLERNYPKGYGVCSIANLKDSNQLIDSICISEGIDGEFVTNENFGCILHKKT